MAKKNINVFWYGFGRTLDMGAVGSRYSFPVVKAQTDAETLRLDWVNVGNYLREAMGDYDNGKQEAVTAE